MTAQAWLGLLRSPTPAFEALLAQTYGHADRNERSALLEAAMSGFIQEFGDGPARVFRCPGRINLRGMHVDTHGGYLNLMTHQREVLVVCRPRTDGSFVFRNSEPIHPPFEFARTSFTEDAKAAHGDWDAFLSREPAAQFPAGWSRYATGAVVRALWPLEGDALFGMDAYVTSDLPEGAALSSSAALSLAIYLATCGLAGIKPTTEAQILASRDAEWFSGARTGTSDPAAMTLGGAGLLAQVALLAEQFTLDTLKRHPFPENEMAVLVVESNTTRQLGGEQLLAYTRNRAAYSIAIDVFRQEMHALGMSEASIAYCDRLSRIDAATMGGLRFLAALLLRVPESLDVDGLRRRYDLPQLDAVLERYFGALPRESWPKEIPLRGPLLFGLAESARAERYFEAVMAGQWERAGRLMSIGHDGDRVMKQDGEAFDRTVQLRDIARLGDNSVPLEEIPGDYAASAPVLDMLVDAALEAGALGASLTGAGIAGSILALCRADRCDAVRDHLINTLTSEAYAKRAGFDAPLSRAQAERSVTRNASVAAAGELCYCGQTVD